MAGGRGRRFPSLKGVRSEMSEKRETITFEKRGEAGWIYFSRPERMNALAPESLRELWARLSELESDPSIRVAVFSGRGDEAFCAGMDLAGLENSPPWRHAGAPARSRCSPTASPTSPCPP